MAVERHNHMVTWKVLGEGPLGKKKSEVSWGISVAKVMKKTIPKEIVIICEILAEILKIGGDKY